MEKSHVGMGYHVCPVCGAHHDEVVLLNKRLEATLARTQLVGYSFCAEDQKKRDEGYIALIEVIAESAPDGAKKLDVKGPMRTGHIAHVRQTIWKDIFGEVPIPEQGMAFVEQGFIAQLQSRIVEEKAE
jgi:hypothetical protein